MQEISYRIVKCLPGNCRLSGALSIQNQAFEQVLNKTVGFEQAIITGIYSAICGLTAIRLHLTLSHRDQRVQSVLDQFSSKADEKRVTKVGPI